MNLIKKLKSEAMFMKQMAEGYVSDKQKEEFSLVVSSLEDYKYKSGELITSMLESTDVLSGIQWRTGYAGDTTIQLNLMSNDIRLSNTACEVGGTGSATIAPRTVVMKNISDRLSICLQDLDQKLPMLNSPGANHQDLTFGTALIDNRLKELAKVNQQLLFQGNTSTGVGNLGKAQGLLQIAAAETGSLAGYLTASTSWTASTARIDLIIAEASETMQEAMDTTIYLSVANFNLVRQGVLALYPYMMGGTGVYLNGAYSDQIDKNAFVYPGTNFIIKGTNGMYASNDAIMLPYSEIYGFTNVESDMSGVDAFYDKVSKSFIVDTVYSLGFQYSNPGNVVYFKKI